MDKSWVHLDRRSQGYSNGMNGFLAVAFAKVAPSNQIRCPCNACRNSGFGTYADVQYHLVKNGMDESYKTWIYHGEDTDLNSVIDIESENQDDAEVDIEDENRDDANAYEMVQTLIESGNWVNPEGNASAPEGASSEKPNPEATKFFKYLDEAQQELYPGCKKMTKLSFIIRFFQLKCLHGLSDNACEGVLELIKLLLPDNHCVPETLYSCQNITRDLGLSYVKTDACINDCVLFRNEYADLDKCPTCLAPRWKFCNDEEGVRIRNRKQTKVPQKVFRYFPLKSRLQRLFLSKDVSISMRWHHDQRVNDGVLRHPADSLSWKQLDEVYPAFASDPRNIRLGLATDGFNPFGAMNTKYSVWPVVLIPYNLPPWLCMKQPYWILSMIIPGPKSPGNDIDVYLQPLIEELIELWEEGAETYDVVTGKNFNLHVVVVWTINDYPALAMTSGWSTKGKLACAPCNKDTWSLRLTNGHKECYMGHRRYLHRHHPHRNNRNAFDGKTEHGTAPRPLSGEEILEQYERFDQVKFGKTPGKRKRTQDRNIMLNWKKKSIFFELPYWKTLLLRHNLDMMHIEKNVCLSKLGSFFDVEGKTKDTIKARLDLKDLGIRRELHPHKVGNKLVYAAACYNLSKEEKMKLCKFFEGVRMPDGYASNIRRCFQGNECSLTGLKTHDFHVIFQQLLPIAIRDILPKEVCGPIIELGKCFVKLCAKELRVEELDELSEQIVDILCRLEQILPPAFFDIMLHLPVHLAEEAKLGGPIMYRWMYMVERFLRTLKGYVRNKAHAEGSMAEGYLIEESMTLCTRFLVNVDTKLNRPQRHTSVPRTEPPFELGIFGSIEGNQQGVLVTLSSKEINRAHYYVLSNCDGMSPWIE